MNKEQNLNWKFGKKKLFIRGCKETEYDYISKVQKYFKKNTYIESQEIG
jgi:hypothetical protein